MQKRPDLTSGVHEAGGRMTRQRRVVLEALASVTSHPTAAELHNLVRERLPGISPGTVYRNLKVLKDLGYVQELCFGPGASRFDANVESHYHVRCDRCGRVDDVPGPAIAGIEDAASALSEWKITGHRLEFHGLCPVCRRAEEQTDQQEESDNEPQGNADREEHPDGLRG